MQAEIITVGTEILIGSILNTNSKYISKKLSELGVHIEYQLSVRDDINLIEDAVKSALKRSDIIVLCGGLGPTLDDITKDAVAKALGRKIYIDENEYKHLLNYFNSVNRKMTKNNIRQSRVIEGSTIFHNKWGIAPGEMIEIENKKIFLLPGPPKEFEPMVDNYVIKNIAEENDIILKSVNIVGIGEAAAETRLRELNLEDEYISVNTFAKFSETEIKIIAEGKDKKELVKKVHKVTEKIYQEFTVNIASEGEIPANEALVEKLIEKNKTISFAESVTGGLLASKITEVKNASKVLKSSYITYSNMAKQKELNVPTEILEKYGAVSDKTAYYMAKGLFNKGYCDLAVSVTGEAGPVPSEKEVGTTYICFYSGEDNYNIKSLKFTGNRNEIQRRIVNYIISHLIVELNEENI